MEEGLGLGRLGGRGGSSSRLGCLEIELVIVQVLASSPGIILLLESAFEATVLRILGSLALVGT